MKISFGFRDELEWLPLPVCVVDSSGLVVAFNQRAQALLGLSLHAPLRRAVRYEAVKELERALGDPGSRAVFECRTHVGTWVSIAIGPCEGASRSGPSYRYVSITEVADVWGRLVREISRTLVQAIPLPALVVSDGQIIAHNRLAETQLGALRTWEELHERVVPERRDAFANAMLGSFGIKTATGEVLPCDVSSVRLEDTQNARLFVFQFEPGGSVPTLTGREPHLENLGLLVAGVAHEISNPLAFVLPTLEELADIVQAEPDLDPEDVGELVTDALGGVRRVVKILRNLRAHRSEAETNTEPVDLNGLLEETIRLGKTRLDQVTRIDLDFGSLQGCSRPGLHGLGQVVLNLVLNAAHAMPSRPPSHNYVRVRTFMRSSGRAACIVVEDNASGIAKSDLSKIFDPFFTKSASGTGLGLAVCKQLVEALGGTISVESEVGVGTRFELSIPTDEAAR